MNSCADNEHLYFSLLCPSVAAKIDWEEELLGVGIKVTTAIAAVIAGHHNIIDG